jgi:hypothetical protein
VSSNLRLQQARVLQKSVGSDYVATWTSVTKYIDENDHALRQKDIFVHCTTTNKLDTRLCTGTRTSTSTMYCFRSQGSRWYLVRAPRTETCNRSTAISNAPKTNLSLMQSRLTSIRFHFLFFHFISAGEFNRP